MTQLNDSFIKKIQSIPYVIPVLVTITCVYGFVILYSASGGSLEPWAYRQIIVFAALMPIAFLIALIDIRFIYHNSYLFYCITIILLIIVEVAGKTAMGATRWIDLGVIRIQPSEIAKIAVVLMLARYFHPGHYRITEPKHIIIAALAAFFPTALIIKQPDLGTGIITLIVASTIFFAAGLRLIYFIASGIFAIVSIPIIWYLMHDYQKNTILIFLNPELEPLGAGYNIIQSKIAIGSGGLLGKGLMNGTQSHLRFLPEYQTDFIFSSLTEELGFVGGIALLILYSVIVIYSIAIAINAKQRYVKLMTIGVITIFFSHAFVNIAMVMGILPVVGVPLPLISYGGTMLASMIISFGLIMNAGVNRYSNV